MAKFVEDIRITMTKLLQEKDEYFVIKPNCKAESATSGIKWVSGKNEKKKAIRPKLAKVAPKRPKLLLIRGRQQIG